MIGVSSDMIFGSVVLSFLLGVAFGALRAVLFGVFRALHTLLSRIKKEAKAKRESRLFFNAFDFLFFTVMGILYLLVLYVSTDGVFFVSSASMLFLGFYLGKKLMGAFFALFSKSKR